MQIRTSLKEKTKGDMALISIRSAIIENASGNVAANHLSGLVRRIIVLSQAMVEKRLVYRRSVGPASWKPVTIK